MNNSQNNIGNLLRGAYVNARQAVRGVIVKNKFLDHYLGNTLVNMDMLIRKTGILNSELKKGYFEYNGFKLYFGKEDKDFAGFIITNNDYDTESREAIEGILEEGDVFVDLGANIGFFTLIAARIVGESGKVFAFEPTPGTKKFLTRNVSENDFDDRVVIEGYAVTDKCGKARFNVTELSECNSICDSEDANTNVIEVDTISLDEYFLKTPSSINLIKMDIEGQEFPAMRGMKEIVKANPDIKIIFEYHKQHIKENNLASVEIFQLLEDYGFNQFTVLLREPVKIKIPEDQQLLEREASRVNLNILAEKV